MPRTKYKIGERRTGSTFLSQRYKIFHHLHWNPGHFFNLWHNSSSSCRCSSFVVTLASAFISQILLCKSKIKVLRNFPHGGWCHLKNPQSKSGFEKNQIIISIAGFQHLHCKNRMNKKEIELHYLSWCICGTDILGFHHSTKSTEASSSRSDTKVVAGMRRGGSRHGTGWAAPSRCSLLRWKPMFFSLRWYRPLGVGARCSHGAVRVQSVAHSEWRGRPGSFIIYAFTSR